MNTSDWTATGTRTGRARLTPGQLWQVPTFVIGLAAFLAVAASSPVRRPPEWWQFDATVAALRQGLLRPQEDPANLVRLAENALLQVHRFGDRAAEVHFLTGSVYYRQAVAGPPAAARDRWLRAAEHLEQAAQLGPDERDVPALQYRLGRSLYAVGRDVPRALELMARAADRGAEQPLAACHLLVQAYLQLPVPDLDEALTASRKVIELTDDRDVDALAQARIAHAELLLRKEQRGEAIKELARVSAKASRPLRLKARLWQAHFSEQEGLWDRALAVWQELRADAAHVPGGPARVKYAVGWCCAQRDPPDFDRAAKAWQEALRLGGLEGQAAGLRLGGLKLFGPTPDAPGGVDAWRQALAAVKSPADYRNPYLEMAEVRGLFDQALGLFHDLQDYEKMRVVAELYGKVAPPGLAEEKMAQAAEAQARKLQADAKAPAQEVQTQYRQAAEDYQRAAQARSDKARFDALWHSARCFLEANDHDRAADLLAQLDRIDQEDARLAHGWYLLAEARRAAGKKEAARAAYLRAMQYAATPFAARARYEVAADEVAKQNWKAAEEILQPNLVGAAPDADALQKSLYQMAWVQLQKQDLGRALFYLKKATGNYPNNPKAVLMRGQLAECYRRLADEEFAKEVQQRQALVGDWPDDKKQEAEERIRNYQDARRKWLREAAGTYQALADDLRERGRQRPLTEFEAVLSRRSLLGLAECRHDLGEFIEALHEYQALLQQHRARIETLIACERIVQLRDFVPKADFLPPAALREIAAAAREAVARAGEDLKAMDPAAPEFQGERVWSWQRWQLWVVAEQKRLAAAGGAVQ